MREVVIYHLLSLDGVAESPDRFFDWDDALDANLAAVIGRQDAVILGRRSYGEWATYWPSSDIEPFATFINGVSKHVVTSTPLEPAWEGAIAVEGDPIAFVRHLKGQPGGDIGVHASTSVAQALLAAGVVDRLQLVVSPVIAGTGRRLFDDLPTTRLELVAGTWSWTTGWSATLRLGLPRAGDVRPDPGSVAFPARSRRFQPAGPPRRQQHPHRQPADG